MGKEVVPSERRKNIDAFVSSSCQALPSLLVLVPPHSQDCGRSMCRMRVNCEARMTHLPS